MAPVLKTAVFALKNILGFFCETALIPPSLAPVIITPGPQAAGTTFGSGDITGIVIAIFAVLAIAIIAFVILRRRQKYRSKINSTRPLPDFKALAFNCPPYIPFITDNSPSTAIAQWKLFELFVATNAPLKLAILDTAQSIELDDIVRYLVYITSSHNIGSKFVNELISDDIRQKQASNILESSTLFRENSAASIAFKYLAKLHGLPFLFYAVGDAMEDFFKKEKIRAEERRQSQKSQSLKQDSFFKKDSGSSSTMGKNGTLGRDGTLKKSNSRNSINSLELTPISVKSGSINRKNSFMDSNFEIDSSKMDTEDDSQTNALALQLRCQKILVSLYKFADLFPQELRIVLEYLFQAVSKNLSLQDGFTSVGGFVFLRFVNPAVLFPVVYGLIDEVPDTPAAKRQLILIAKVLQNLANGVKFGQKEAFMIPLNDFIESNQASYRKFLEEISRSLLRFLSHKNKSKLINQNSKN